MIFGRRLVVFILNSHKSASDHSFRGIFNSKWDFPVIWKCPMLDKMQITRGSLTTPVYLVFWGGFCLFAWPGLAWVFWVFLVEPPRRCRTFLAFCRTPGTARFLATAFRGESKKTNEKTVWCKRVPVSELCGVKNCLWEGVCVSGVNIVWSKNAWIVCHQFQGFLAKHGNKQHVCFLVETRNHQFFSYILFS